jgi:putative glutamine amidotransferase
MHLINVACGGTLVDVDEASVNADRHVNDWKAGEQYVHDVYLSPNSGLVSAARGRTTVRVNSHHRHCIDQLGAGFAVAARASDGVIEAIERRGGSYCVGIQWHPECLLDQGDDFALAIMTCFVQACRSTKRAPCWSNK